MGFSPFPLMCTAVFLHLPQLASDKQERTHTHTHTNSHTHTTREHTVRGWAVVFLCCVLLWGIDGVVWRDDTMVSVVIESVVMVTVVMLHVVTVKICLTEINYLV